MAKASKVYVGATLPNGATVLDCETTGNGIYAVLAIYRDEYVVWRHVESDTGAAFSGRYFHDDIDAARARFINAHAAYRR
jgi:hypothetical protein